MASHRSCVSSMKRQPLEVEMLEVLMSFTQNLGEYALHSCGKRAATLLLELKFPSSLSWDLSLHLWYK